MRVFWPHNSFDGCYGFLKTLLSASIDRQLFEQCVDHAMLYLLNGLLVKDIGGSSGVQTPHSMSVPFLVLPKIHIPPLVATSRRKTPHPPLMSSSDPQTSTHTDMTTQAVCSNALSDDGVLVVPKQQPGKKKRDVSAVPRQKKFMGRKYPSTTAFLYTIKPQLLDLHLRQNDKSDLKASTAENLLKWWRGYKKEGRNQGDIREVRAPPSFSWGAVLKRLAAGLSISSTRTASSLWTGSSSNRPRGPTRTQILRVRTMPHRSPRLR